MAEAPSAQQRTVTGPGFDLLFAQQGDHPVATVWFHKAFRTHPELRRGFGDAEVWLRQPDIPGLACLHGEVLDGAFSYQAPPSLSVRELVDRLKAKGNACGPRACAEFLRAVGEVLVRASRRGARVGVYAHGALTPWTVLVDEAAQPHVIGYAMPRADVFGFLDDDQVRLPGDALRYTAPEVIENAAQDLSSDLMALCLMAVELLTGHHAFVGDADEVLEQIHRGEGPVAMAELGEGYPAELVVILARAVSRRPTERFRRGQEFLRAIDALGTLEGPTLEMVVRTAWGTPAEPVETDDVPELDLDDDATGEVPLVEVEVEFDDDEPDPNAFDDAPTRALGVVPVVEALSGPVTLERVQAHATEVVERAGVVADTTRKLADLCRDEGRSLGLEAAADVDRAASAARRAEKARDSARGASNLVDMDETAAEAQVTLTLVHGAARQADVALQSAVDALLDIRRSAHRIQGEMVRVEAAREQAPEGVARSRSAVRAVARTADVIRADVAAGKLPMGAGDANLVELKTRAERALRIAEESAQALESATLAEVADAAVQRLLDAAAAGESAADAAKALLDTLRADVDRARLEAVDTARRAADGLTDRCQRLTDRLESAESANSVSPTPAAADAISQARAVLDGVLASRDQAHELAERAAASDSEAEAVGHASQAKQLAQSAEADLLRASAAVDDAVTATRLAAEALARRQASSRDAERAVEQADAALDGVRPVMDRLVADTQEVTGSQARAAIREAVAAWTTLQRAGVEARGHAARVATAPNDEVAAEALRDARETSARIVGGADNVQDLARVARETSNRELADIRRQRQAEQALSDAVTEARQSAAACAKAVAMAQEELGRVTALVRDADLAEAERLRADAAEVIDIAAYQSSEAQDAARQAKAQASAEEASRYADTARSFRERIEEDLPAAHRALAKAAGLVEENAERREAARKRLGEFEARVDQGKRSWTEAITTARHEARGWSGSAVREALSVLEQLGSEFDTQGSRVLSAKARAESARSASDMESAASTAHEAAARTEALVHRLQGAAAAVEAAVTAARTEADALDVARETVSRARTRCADALDTARSTQLDTQRAILPHAATGAVVTQGIARLDAITRRMEAMGPELDLLAQGVAAAADREAAEPLAGQATGIDGEIRALLDEARVLATDVVQAAESEAATRASDALRRREEAIRVVTSANERASDIRERVTAAIEAAREEVSESDSDEAHDRFAAATRGAMRVSAACERLDDLVERIRHDDPELVAPESAPLLQLAETCAQDVNHALEEAKDAARHAVEEASALQTVREEVASLGGRARAAVEVARIRSSEISQCVAEAERPSTREVTERAQASVSLAEKAAKKAAAAGPMVALVSELAAAEPIVRAARMSAERAEEVAASMVALLEEAQRRVDEERAEAARRLDEARSDARHPLSEARAAVARAQGFVTEAEQLANGLDDAGVSAAVAALKSAADDVRVRAGDTVRIGDDLASALDLDAVLDLADRIRLGTDSTIAALGDATQRMEAARDAITVVRERQQQLDHAQTKIADAAMSAQEAATGCRNTLDEVKTVASTLDEPADAVSQLLADMDAACDRAETAAADALGLSLEVGEVDRPGLAQDMAERAGAALERAIGELAAVVELERKTRVAIDAAKEEAARKAAEAAQHERRRLPRRSSGSSGRGNRSDRLRQRLEAAGGAPRPTRASRARQARRTQNSEINEAPAATVPEGSSEDRIAKLRKSLRANGPARSRSERMVERQAGDRSRTAPRRPTHIEPPAEELAGPKRESFATGAHAVPRAPRPAGPGDSAAEARRKKREALRARLRKSRRDDD